MFHKIESIKPLNDFNLQVRFIEGVTKIFDIKPLFNIWEVIKTLKGEPALLRK